MTPMPQPFVKKVTWEDGRVVTNRYRRDTQSPDPTLLMSDSRAKIITQEYHQNNINEQVSTVYIEQKRVGNICHRSWVSMGFGRGSIADSW